MVLAGISFPAPSLLRAPVIPRWKSGPQFLRVSGAGLIVCILLGCLAAAAFAGPLDAVKGDSMVDSLIDDIESTSDLQLAAEARARLAAAKTFTCTGDAANLKAGLKALAGDTDGTKFQTLSDGWVVTASKTGSKFFFVSVKPTAGKCKTKNWLGVCTVYYNNCPTGADGKYTTACEEALGGLTGLTFASAANVEGTVCPLPPRPLYPSTQPHARGLVQRHTRAMRFMPIPRRWH